MFAFVRRVVQAVWYGGLAALILVGIPYACVRYVGWPLPRSVPDGPALRDWIDHPFTPTRLGALLSIIGWLVWAGLVFFLATEIAGRAGRYRVPRLTPLSPLQGIAAGVVGATVVAAPAVAHASAPPQVPASPAAADRGTKTDVDASPVYVVERGDWLSAVAARFLGDPDAYSRLVDLNPYLADRGPSHIEAGWLIQLPSDAHDYGIRAHAAGHLQQPLPAPALPVPSTVEPKPTPSSTPTIPATPTTPAAPVDDIDGDGGGQPDVVIAPSSHGAMAGAGLLAAMLFALLTAERRRLRGLHAAEQASTRASGRADRELLAAQQPADVERLDAALRNLAAGLAGRVTVPDIVGVRLVGGDVQILLAAPDDDPPAPWLDEGTQWALPAYIDTPTTVALPALLPTLVTIGSRAGRHLHIDLERLGILSIGGHPYRARDLLRHIACELACNTWSDNATVILAGFGDEADTMTTIGPERIAVAESAAAGIGMVRTELSQRMASGSTSPPTLLLVASPDAATRTALGVLQRELAGTGRCGMAVVATVPDNTAIGTALLSVAENGQVRAELPGLRLTTDAAAVPIDMLEPLAAVFRVARQDRPATQAQQELPAWEDSIDPIDGVLAVFDTVTIVDIATTDARPSVMPNPAPASEPLDDDLANWHDDTSTRPRIGILGPVQVRMPGVLNDSRHRLYTEILLYLLTRPSRSATRAAIEDALWYGYPAGAGTIRNAISKLRTWLGPRDDANEWIWNDEDGGEYHLEDGILFDWHLLLALNQRGTDRGADGITDLHAALALVRSAPMSRQRDTGPYRRPYTWIGDSDIATGRILATIAGIAHRLAQHHLDFGDPDGARWAIDQAWLADPDRSFDELWHDRMHAEQMAGDSIALQRLVNEYLIANEAEVPEDLPPKVYNRIRAILPAA